MIAYLKGKIKLYHPGFIILDVNGVGYKVFCSLEEAKEKDDIELYIHENIREDCDDLYGFKSFDELDLFQKLISVNGVGPKAGISILSVYSYDKIIQAILSDNVAFFKAVPGIGQKVAAKIILDLKTKIGGLLDSATLSKVGNSAEIIDALTSLGYKPAEINKVLTNLPGELKTSEEKITWCLKNLSRG